MQLNKLVRSPALFLLLAFIRPTGAHADLIIDIAASDIAVGSSTSIDVTIRSADANSAVLGFYDVRFQISSLSATAGTSLQFVNPQSENHLSSNEYMFFGVSTGAPTTFVSGVANSQLFASDTVEPAGNVSVNAPLLMAQLDISHHFPANVSTSSLVGEQFQISLASATFETFDGANYVAYSGGFTDNPGVITVAVPEPTASSLIAILCIWGCTRRSARARGCYSC